MDNTFKKGLILGGLLAVGAAVGFALTHEGQQLSEELQKDLKVLAKHVKKNLHNMQNATEESFDELVATVVGEYAKKKELADGAKKMLVTVLQAKWHEMEKDYLSEQDEEPLKHKTA